MWFTQELKSTVDTWIVVCGIVFYPCGGKAETDVRESLQLLVQQVVQRLTKIHFCPCSFSHSPLDDLCVSWCRNPNSVMNKTGFKQQQKCPFPSVSNTLPASNIRAMKIFPTVTCLQLQPFSITISAISPLFFLLLRLKSLAGTPSLPPQLHEAMSNYTHYVPPLLQICNAVLFYLHKTAGVMWLNIMQQNKVWQLTIGHRIIFVQVHEYNTPNET